MADEKVNVRWFRGSDEEEKKTIKSEVKTSLYVLKRLKKIISEEIETVRLKARRPEALQSPNWANLQAYYLGIEEGLSRVDNLLTKDAE